MLPVFIRFGGFLVTSYMMMIALAGVVTLLIFKKFDSKLGLNHREDFWFLANSIGFSGFIGGRLHYLFSGPFVFQGFGDFASALVSNQTGLSTFGAFLGVLCGTCYACWYLGVDYLRVFDYASLAIPVGHAIARIGCFLNGCCYGHPVEGHPVWSVVFTDPAAAVPAELLGVPLHPTQLYEAGGDLILAGLLYFLVRPRVGQGRFGHGLVCAGFLAGYGMLRFATESFGGNPAMLAGMSMPAAKIFSLIMIGLAVVFLIRAAKWRQPPGSRFNHHVITINQKPPCNSTPV